MANERQESTTVDNSKKNSQGNGQGNGQQASSNNQSKVGSIKWFEEAIKDITANKDCILAVVSDCIASQHDEFRAEKYQIKLSFRISTTNAIGRTVTSLRSGWLKDDVAADLGEVFQLNMAAFVPVSNTYLSDNVNDRPVTNVETGEVKYLASSLWFVKRDEAKERFLAGQLTKVGNGMFAYKYVLPEGWIYGNGE